MSRSRSGAAAATTLSTRSHSTNNYTMRQPKAPISTTTSAYARCIAASTRSIR